MDIRKEEKSITGLLSDLTRDITTLFRQEIRLVKTEMSEKVEKAESGLTMLVVGGAVAYAGFLMLLLAAILGLSLYVDPWVAALIVAVVILVVGLIMLGKGKSSLKARNLMPEKTVESLQRDRSLAQKHTAASH
ncbi:MAG: hypothetical protein VR65_09875 [Desulfobulbaceae bacterium BRH_c16a]|nr:MAG: hypothetical protein VR65_09875 [Desulfobulbaceae bacterium BRH_c16a]